MAHHKSRDAVARRAERADQRRYALSLQWQYCWQDPWNGDVIWTHDTTTAVVAGLEARYGYVAPSTYTLPDGMRKEGLVLRPLRVLQPTQTEVI